MKKLFAIAFSAILIVCTTTLSARTPGDGDHHSTFQVSFFPPLGTNGRHAELYTNDISLNLLVGLSKNERVVAFAGLVNLIKNNAAGVQMAGLANYVGNDVVGLQFGGLANIARGDVKGLQFGGLFNTANGFEGLQFGGLANVAGGDAIGLQFGGLANVAGGDAIGLQFGGLANIVRGDREGLQFGGLANIVHGDAKGLQFGGLANIVRGDVKGLQFGGLFNVAKNVRGVQFAGIVNIAERSDYPIGIVNIIKEGEMGIGVGYNEIGTVSLTFRSGGRVLYGIIGLGYNHKVAESRDALSIVGGYGAHINILPWLRINNEFMCENIDIICNENPTFKSGYALMPALRLGNFEIFGGPSVNYMYSKEPRLHGIFPKNTFWKKEKGTLVQQAYIGWQFGAQFVF